MSGVAGAPSTSDALRRVTGDKSNDDKGQSSIVEAALYGLCPRCGARSLFNAPLQVANTCRACALDFAPLERGARLAGVLTLLIAVALIGLALWLDSVIRLPSLVLALIWIPLTLGAVLGGVRLMKTVLLYARYETLRERGEI